MFLSNCRRSTVSPLITVKTIKITAGRFQILYCFSPLWKYRSNVLGHSLTQILSSVLQSCAITSLISCNSLAQGCPTFTFSVGANLDNVKKNPASWEPQQIVELRVRGSWPGLGPISHLFRPKAAQKCCQCIVSITIAQSTLSYSTAGGGPEAAGFQRSAAGHLKSVGRLYLAWEVDFGHA